MFCPDEPQSRKRCWRCWIRFADVCANLASIRYFPFRTWKNLSLDARVVTFAIVL
jgi:hypothetical protein